MRALCVCGVCVFNACACMSVLVGGLVRAANFHVVDPEMYHNGLS